MNLLPIEMRVLSEAFDTVKGKLLQSRNIGVYKSIICNVVEALDEEQWPYNFLPFPSFQWADFSGDTTLVNFPSINRSLLVSIHEDWPCTDYTDYIEEHFSTWFPLEELKPDYYGVRCSTLYLMQKVVDESIIANPLSSEGDVELSRDRLSKIPERLLAQVQGPNLHNFKCNLL